MGDDQGPGEWAELETLGRVTLAMLGHGSWLARRVETVSFLDSSRLEHRVTLDLDGRKIREIVRSSGGDPDQPILVPLTILTKGLLLDLDLRAGDGRAMPVAVSDRDARAAQAAILAQLDEVGVGVGALSKAIRQSIFNAAYKRPSDADQEGLTYATDFEVEAWSLAQDLSSPEGETARWADLFKYPEFFDLMVTFTLRFMLMASLTCTDEVQIVKYRYVESQQPSELLLFERLGGEPFSTLLPAPGVGNAAREHLRIDAPDGMFLESLYLWDVPGLLTPGSRKIRPAQGARRYERRLIPERGVIYTSGLGRGEYYVALSMRPKVQTFLRPSQLTVLASFVFLVAGALAQTFGRRLSSPSSNTEAAVALLLVVPSVMSAFLARAGEHQLLSDLLRWPRLAVGASAYISLLAGGAMVVHVAGTPLAIVWYVAAAITGLVLLLLVVVTRASGAAMRDVQRDADKTEFENVVTLEL